LAPFFVAILSKLWLKDSLPKYTIPALIISLFGAILMLSSIDFQKGEFFNLTAVDAIGMSLALFSCFFLALGLVMIRWLGKQNISGGPVLLSQFMFTVLLSPIFSVIVGENWGNWAGLSPFGIFLFITFVMVFVFGNVFQQHAIFKLKSASVVSTIQPWRLISSLLSGMALLGEKLENPLQYVGMFIVFLAVGVYMLLQVNVDIKGKILNFWNSRHFRHTRIES
jgi:drug/metabolite transporter (DMT)-like permease